MSIRTGRKLHGFVWKELPITEEVITRVEDLGKQDKQPLTEKGPIFEWSPVNIILDQQEDEEDFDNIINDLQQHHNYHNCSDYVPDGSDGDDNILGSWESEYSAMDEEEGMIVTDDDISKGGV